jgi:hypothetical protein
MKTKRLRAWADVTRVLGQFNQVFRTSMVGKSENGGQPLLKQEEACRANIEGHL